MGLFRNKKVELLEYKLLAAQHENGRLTRRVSFLEGETQRDALRFREQIKSADSELAAASTRILDLQAQLAEAQANSVVVPIRGAGGKFTKRGG